ncbi:MAG: GIY-YIG nuclease family protein [Thermoproteota archaeon]|nr:GIY-YIG nuclease family protein [Thermoproteota archaeon]
MAYYVYILRCEDGSYYTGYAKNVETRVKQHKRGKGALYTRMRKPEKLVYVEEFDTRSEAMRMEREIKQLSHEEKMKLANSYRNVTRNQKS